MIDLLKILENKNKNNIDYDQMQPFIGAMK